jgi:PPK2 family polyphosphate:nucleotide phosphotransferase
VEVQAALDEEIAAHEAAAVEEIRDVANALRVGKGFVLADVDTSSTPGFTGDKMAGKAALKACESELADLLEQLFADSLAGGRRSVLLVVQGMDTSGKGGIMRHVISVNPQGVKATGFKAPTKEELAHDFLWRIEKALPEAGQLGVFDRSHYEDVLVVRVHELVPEPVWSKRYAQINAFERKAIAAGTTVIKVMTHISKDEQKERLMERLERPDKYYKYNPGDVDERGRWDAYMVAYQAVLDKTSTVGAPWHVVPADRKWYARLAVQQLLLDALRGMNLQWPPADFDVEGEKKRLASS